MASFPGTQIAGGAGTFVLLPNGIVINYGDVKDFTLAADTITFTFISGAAAYPYVAPSDLYAQKVLNVIRSIPDQPASFYVVSALFPTYAILSVLPITGAPAGGDVVTVTGVGFVDGLVANLGGTAVVVTFISETSFTFVTPAGTVNEFVNLYTRNPDNSETILPTAFQYL